MHCSKVLRTLTGAAIFSPVLAAPRPQGNVNPAERPSNIAIATVPDATNGPPQATGSLYGSPSLLGNNGAHPDDTIPPGEGAVVNDGTLVPGQTADADDGLFLDFQNAANPQPIRGDGGATDPGPRKFHNFP